MAKAKHPIFFCVFHDRSAAVRRLVEAEPALIRRFGVALLTQAAARNSVKSAAFLLDKGVGSDRKSGSQWPPMVWASYRGHVAMVRLLIRRGAGVDRAHGNPIHYAGQRGHREICRLLVTAGAIKDVVAKLPDNARKLFRAAYSFDVKTVERLLVKNPTLVNAVDRDGRTALHEACTHGDVATVKALLKHGADPRVPDKQGESPLVRARKHRKKRVLELLERVSGPGAS